ncbi:alanine-zipper protein [Pseudomonas sp. WJP1]|nr:alanine-zipper protein [Pseudomonas sp. WJP1]WCM48504.1 alanine-zipper protein [Pseudomonas sp. WJP1]
MNNNFCSCDSADEAYVKAQLAAAAQAQGTADGAKERARRMLERASRK